MHIRGRITKREVAVHYVRIPPPSPPLPLTLQVALPGTDAPSHFLGRRPVSRRGDMRRGAVVPGHKFSEKSHTNICRTVVRTDGRTS